MTLISVSYPVPYTCQYASSELVRAFIHGEQPLEGDPNWQLYGAASPEEYAYWAQRACGVVCVKMAVEGLCALPPESVMAWIRAGLARGGYLAERRPERPAIEKGWKHAALAQLAADHDLHAELVNDLTLHDMLAEIRADRLLITSVSSELGEQGPVTRRSGHLVVVFGMELDQESVPHTILLHNPSGRTRALRKGARIAADRFMRGFSGRGIIIGKQQKTGTTPHPAPES